MHNIDEGGLYYEFLGCSRRHHCSRIDFMFCLMRDGTAVLIKSAVLFLFVSKLRTVEDCI